MPSECRECSKPLPTARDEAFLAEIKKKGLTIEATGAEEMTRIYADAFASPPGVVEAVKAILGAKEGGAK